MLLYHIQQISNISSFTTPYPTPFHPMPPYSIPPHPMPTGRTRTHVSHTGYWSPGIDATIDTPLTTPSSSTASSIDIHGHNVHTTTALGNDKEKKRSKYSSEETLGAPLLPAPAVMSCHVILRVVWSVVWSFVLSSLLRYFLFFVVWWFLFSFFSHR